MRMFELGDPVRWQQRNKYRSNPRTQASFYMYDGKIVSVSPVTAEYRYCGRDDEGKTVVKTMRQEFRLLRNGRYIAKSEDRDDAKGRLYLVRT